MKYTKIIKSTLLTLELIAVLFLMNSCSEMGKQPPIWESGMFSTDGKYYAYTYSELFVMQYSKRGGATFRSGISSYYLQVIDCTTGKKMIEQPVKSKEMIRVQKIEGNNILLWTYTIGKSLYSPAIFDMGTQKMKFTSEDLRSINSDVPMNTVYSYFNYSNSQPGFIFEGDNGRKYIIDPNTGKTTIVSGEFERSEDQSSTCYQTVNSTKGYSRTNDSRQRITIGSSRNSMMSQDDFLEPKFLVINLISSIDEKPLTFYGNNIFIFSSISKTDKKEMQLSMLDKYSLMTKWNIILPQEVQERNNYNKERFALNGNKMYVANSTNLHIIDLDKGAIKATYPLFMS